MSIASNQTVSIQFITTKFDTGVATDADSNPTATLVKNGVDHNNTVTVVNIDTGRYRATVVLPALVENDIVEIVVTATVNSVTGKGTIWRDTCNEALSGNNLIR